MLVKEISNEYEVSKDQRSKRRDLKTAGFQVLLLSIAFDRQRSNAMLSAHARLLVE
jgi:hypothetical protein